MGSGRTEKKKLAERAAPRTDGLGREEGQSWKNKSNPDGPGNCGRGEGGSIDTEQGRGPERSWRGPWLQLRQTELLAACSFVLMAQKCPRLAKRLPGPCWPLLAPVGPCWSCLLPGQAAPTSGTLELPTLPSFPSRDPSLLGPRTP